MKSGTSYFNLTLFKKNLTRYWPVWALYTLIWTYALPIDCLLVQQQDWRGATTTQRVAAFADRIPDLLEGFGLFMAFAFGILAAMSMFSYLYNNRAAGLIHALPVRREGLFLTNYLAGLVCLLGPHLLVWLLTLGAESLCGYTDLHTVSVWLAAQSGMCVFFYSFAVFCAQFCGHLLALPAFYGILNFLVAAVMGLLGMLFRPFLYGYVGLSKGADEVIEWLTPVVRLAENVSWQSSDGIYRLKGVPELIAYTAAGLVFAVLALLVYRRRHVETAGDVVAVRAVRPVFKYGVALCSGLCFGYWLYAIFGFDAPGGLTGSLLLWTAIGYFVAEMLLKKSFRVWKAWRGCAVIVVLVAIGLTCLRMDAFGFVTRVPVSEQVASVAVDGMGSYPYDQGRSFQFETEDPALVEKVIALHRAIVNEHSAPESGAGAEREYIRLAVAYTLTNGTTLCRNYGAYLSRDTALAKAAQDFYCDPEVAKLSYRMDKIDPDRLVNMEVGSLWNTTDKFNEYYDFELMIPGEDHYAAMRAVYDAVMLDFEQGNLGRRYLFDLEEARQNNTCVTDLVIYWNAPYDTEGALPRDTSMMEAASSYVRATHHKSITLTPNAHNTIRVLTELGVLDEDTTLRLYRDIVDEEQRAKLIYGDTDINLNPNSAMGIIGGADGPTSIIVAEAATGGIVYTESHPKEVG